MVKLLQFFLLSFIFCFNIWGQNNIQDHSFVSIKEGIPKVGVSDIIQDHKGFIWIATNSTGIYKFNGIDYTSYKHVLNDSTSLSSSRVECSFIDSKNRLWIGTENGLNLYNNNLEQFKRITLDTKNPNNDNITSITEDASNNLFIGTSSFGIYKLNIKTLKIDKVQNSTFNTNGQRININSINHIGNNTIYVATNFGLKEVDIDNNKLIATKFHTETKNYFDNEISTLFLDNKENLWVGMHANEGVYKCTLNKNNSIIDVKQISFTSKKIMSIVQLSDETMMIGTENDGLYHIDKNDNILKHFTYNKQEENGILHNSIWKLFVDKDDRIWMGYYNSGVAVSDELFDKFKNIKSLPNKDNSLKIASVMGIVNDENKNLWIATDGGGIDILNLKTHKITHLNTQDKSEYVGLTSNHIISLFKDSKENIWAGSWDNGLYFIKKGTKKIINYNVNHASGELKSNTIRSFAEDANGIIWIGSFFKGLHSLNPSTGELIHYSSTKFIRNGLTTADIVKVLIDSDDNLWLATTTNGLFKVEKEGIVIKEITPLFNKMNKLFDNSINVNYIQSLYEDSKNNIWIGTRGVGLCVYNKTTDKFNWFNKSNGLTEENVAAIIEDEDNNIWVSGNYGLTKIDLDPLEFTNYTFNDGLLSNDFNFGSVFKDSEGILYFGNFKGLDYFNPKKLKTNSKVPLLHLTNFKLFNEKIIPDNQSPLTKVISETENLTLNSDQSVFTIEYAGINFTRPEKNNYAYYLEGYEYSWNYVGQKRSATYTNLDHGNYVFKLKASNNDGVWNEIPLELNIKILPPWWKTNWAIASYILAFILGLYLLNYLTQNRIKEKEQIRNERLQRLQKDELNKKKIQFFTNISHEFRTPLTLIMNPLKDIIHDTELNLPQYVKNKHAIINKNTDRLYRLINELMDFRKLELNKINVRAKKIHLIDFSKNIVSYFQEEANNKNILLSVDADNPDLAVWADVKMLEKIIFNLLSNAIKVTPEGGAINIELLSTEQLYNLPLVNQKEPVKAIEINVSDTGPGLEKNQINKIFERFYQVESKTKSYFGGTGIGLEVVQSFIKLHKGKIEVNSEVGLGTTFKILLPDGNNHFNENQIILNQDVEFLKKEAFLYNPPIIDDYIPDEDIEISKQHTVLIVEDNIDLRDYLKLELNNTYKVLIANNGNEGLKIAKETFPDVIITDVIMPEINGMEFCRMIKSNISTSHIPVLMLTAKAKIDDRIEGIETGADAYMVKPFNIRLLKLRLGQLITSRQLIFNKYFSVISEIPEDINTTPLDKEFIENVLNHINENIGDPNLNVESLAFQLNLSRSQFYRKVKALTNQTATEFLRNIRLQKAKQILEMGETNISKVCYSIGFSSHSYFTKCFKNYFGILPTEVKHTKTN